MNTQIASAAEQQSAVADEMNRNIVDVSRVADKTSEGTLRTAAASRQLGELAQHLRDLMQCFRVNAA